MNEQLNGINTRVRVLEEKVSDMEKGVAVVGAEFINLKDDLREIKSGITWVQRLILGSLVSGILYFIISGGISVV
jgi:archaellum component FlaC